MTDFIEAQTKYLQNKGYKIVLNVLTYDHDSDGYHNIEIPEFINIAYKGILPTSQDHNFMYYNFGLNIVFKKEFIKEMNDEN